MGTLTSINIKRVRLGLFSVCVKLVASKIFQSCSSACYYEDSNVIRVFFVIIAHIKENVSYVLDVSITNGEC